MNGILALIIEKLQLSIYQKKNDTFYNDIVKCINDSRTDNKNLVIDKVVDMLLKLL